MKKIYKIILAGLLLGIYSSAFAAAHPQASKPLSQHPTEKEIQENVAKISIPFIQNSNPLSAIKFTSQLKKGNFAVTNTGELIYDFTKQSAGMRFSESFITDRPVRAEGADRSAAKINSFVGNDSSKWQTDIPAFNSINLGEVFEGIRVNLQVKGKNVEKVFTVAPHANPELIKLKINPANQLNLKTNGELEIINGKAEISFSKPIAFQEINGKRIKVDIAYELLGNNSYGFEVGQYDRNFALIIDPLLGSTFLGGSNFDATPEVYGGTKAIVIATDPNDSQEYVYVTGSTDLSPAPTTAFPTTSGPLGAGGNDDIFISKFNLDLTTLVASTRLGGTLSDFESVIAADSNGNIFVTGTTASTNFPTTAGAYDTSDNPNGEGFVTKLNPALTSMLASTYIGGDTSDKVHTLAINQNTGRVYIGLDINSATISAFPVTAGAYDITANSSGSNVALASFDNNLSNTAGAYIGTWMGTEGYYPAIGIDSNDNVFIQIASIDSLTEEPAGTAYQPAQTGGNDNVVVKMDAALSTVSASTYFGGAGWESYLTNNLIITPDDSVVIAAETDDGPSLNSVSLANPNNLSTTHYCPDTIDTVPPIDPPIYNDINACIYPVFAAKFNNNLTQGRVTIIGSDGENGTMLGADNSNNIYLEFSAYATDIPVTVGAYDETDNDSGNADIVVSKFTPELNLITASYLGGNNYDSYAWGVDFDASGNVYFYGEVNSPDFPTTSGAYDTSYNSGGDVFISKFSPNLTYNDAVTNLASTVLSGTAVGLDWSVPTSFTNITGYEVHYGTAAAGCDPTDIDDTDCSTATSATTSATISGLTPSTQYLFTVYGLGPSSTQRSPSSNTVTATPIGYGGTAIRIYKYDTDDITAAPTYFEIPHDPNNVAENVTNTFIDSVNNLMYMVLSPVSTNTPDNTIIVYKINLTAETIVDTFTETFPSSEHSIPKSNDAEIDLTNGFLYLTVSGDLDAIGNSNPYARIEKIALNGPTDDMSYVGELKLKATSDPITASVIDTTNQYMYVAYDNTRAKIVKIDLNVADNLPPVKVVEIYLVPDPDQSPNEMVGAQSAVIDTINGYAYFGSSTDPNSAISSSLHKGFISKVDIDPNRNFEVVARLQTTEPSFSTIDSLRGAEYFSFDSNLNVSTTAHIDVDNQYAYFAGSHHNYPINFPVAKIYRVDLENFTHDLNYDELNYSSNETASIRANLFVPELGKGYLVRSLSGGDVITVYGGNTSSNLRLQSAPNIDDQYCNEASDTSYVWSNVPNTDFTLEDSPNLTDGQATNNTSGLLSDNNSTFVPGQVKESGSATTGTISMGRSGFTEVEYSIKATAAAKGSYCFRVVDQDALNDHQAGANPNFVFGRTPVGFSSQTTNYYVPLTINGVILSKTGISLIEGTSTDNYGIKLATQPTGNVTVTVNADDNRLIVDPDATPGTPTQTAITFTTADWDQYQYVTLSATLNTSIEGTTNGLISHTTTSSDPAYDGIFVRSVTSSVTDYGSTTANVTANVVGSVSITTPGNFSFPDAFINQNTPIFSPDLVLSVDETRGVASDYAVTLQASLFCQSPGICIPLNKVFSASSDLINSFNTFTVVEIGQFIANYLQTGESLTNRSTYVHSNSAEDRPLSDPITLIDTRNVPSGSSANPLQGLLTFTLHLMIDYGNFTGLQMGTYTTTLTFDLNQNP